MQCSTIECVGLIYYCSVQVPGVVVLGGKWSLVSLTTPEWSSEVLWSGSESLCLLSNVGMLSSTSLGMSAPYRVMMGLCTVVISDTFGS